MRVSSKAGFLLSRVNGSYDIGFTMDLACKDLDFASRLGQDFGVPLVLEPAVAALFEQARTTYGGAAWSPMVVKLLEDNAPPGRINQVNKDTNPLLALLGSLLPIIILPGLMFTIRPLFSSIMSCARSTSLVTRVDRSPTRCRPWKPRESRCRWEKTTPRTSADMRRPAVESSRLDQ